MKQIGILMIIVAATLVSSAQKKTPEEKSIVNKQFDENGNLIQYDSTYVWSWNSDSTFISGFPMNGFFNGHSFPGLGDAFMDSLMNQQFNQQFFSFNPFEDGDIFRDFGKQFNDSAFSLFGFPSDSAFTEHFNMYSQFQQDFGLKELEQMQKEFQQQFEHHKPEAQKFENDEQRKEWEALMKKQQKEQQDLLNQWNSRKNPENKDNQDKKLKEF